MLSQSREQHNPHDDEVLRSLRNRREELTRAFAIPPGEDLPPLEAAAEGLNVHFSRPEQLALWRQYIESVFNLSEGPREALLREFCDKWGLSRSSVVRYRSGSAPAHAFLSPMIESIAEFAERLLRAS